MNQAPKSREFAQRLIALEARGHSSELEVPAFLACARLRLHLAVLMGSAGFAALMARALSLASAEVDWLATVNIQSDGTLNLPVQGTQEITPEQLAEGGCALMIQLLGLLTEFIGQDLTLHLVQEAWPELSDGASEMESRMKMVPNPANGGPPAKAARPAAKVTIKTMPTGVPGLDDILGGGIPQYSFNVIAGSPGCGKTTLAHQIVFANATPAKPALYFTVLGEPAIKMLRYQQQYSFFDGSKLSKAIHFVNLADVVLEKDLDAVLEEIIKQVKAIRPAIVVVDSFRTVVRKAGDSDMQGFTQRLAQFLTSWQATTFLVGEYAQEEMRDNPLFTVADGLLWLWQLTQRNSVVRKLQVIKLRGQASVPGMHTIRITSNGVHAFSRTLGLVSTKTLPARNRRLSVGIPELDAMLGGGIPEGDSLLVAGPSGTGKSALATQFIAEGLRHGEAGIIAIFEERPEGYSQRAASFGLSLKPAKHKGRLEILYLRPLDLSVDETMQEILNAIQRVGAKRLVIDSLVGFEMALAPGFREDFRESLYRMISALTGAGITVLSTVEVEDTFTAMSFSHYAISFLTDDIIRMRYVEIDGQLRKVMVVIKMRGGNHSKDIREYVITDKGVVIILPRQTDYTGLTSGLPTRVGMREEAAPEPKALK